MADERLGKASSQIIAVEKRLLARVRDKNPAKIEDMFLLLSSCQSEVSEAAGNVEKARKLETTMASALSATVKAFCLLVKLWRQLSDEEYAVLLSVMQPDSLGAGVGGRGGLAHGWEEMVDTAVVYLLRSVLTTRSEKDTVFNPSPLVQPSDNGETLMKHIRMMLDRLAKGGRLANVDNASQNIPNQQVKLAPKNPINSYLDENSANAELGVAQGDSALPPVAAPKTSTKKKFKKNPKLDKSETQQEKLGSLPPGVLPSLSLSGAGTDDTSLPDLGNLAVPQVSKTERRRSSQMKDEKIPDLDDM